MILDTNKIEEKALANFKGGEKALNARMHVDKNNKIKLYFLSIENWYQQIYT